MRDRAPNFTGSYPMAGERVGPGWQRIWDLLADGRARDVQAIYTSASGDLARTTVENLLRRAAKHGKIACTLKLKPGTTSKRCYYWRALPR